MRAKFDSKYAALYYPWVRCSTRHARRIYLPPSGFVAGIYARNDINRAVYKAPGQRGGATSPSASSSCSTRRSRTCSTRRASTASASSRAAASGCGARARSAPIRSGSTSTCGATSPTWSTRSTRARSGRCSSPTATQLWANVRRTIEDFLLNEWQIGRAARRQAGEGVLRACDRSTMTQNDLDNGRLVCLIGVAAAAAGRVRDLPHRPVDRRQRRVT